MGLVDLLVWVVDPQKYADARCTIATCARSPGTPPRCSSCSTRATGSASTPGGAREDLARLLATHGLGDVPVLAASARTGDGLGGCAPRWRIASPAARRRSPVSAPTWTSPRASSPRRRARESRPACAAATASSCWPRSARRRGSRPSRPPRSAHRRRGALATGLPWVSWLRRLRPDPLKRLRLGDAPREDVRTSLPAPTSVQRAQVDAGIRALAGDAAPRPARPVAERSPAGRRRIRDELADRLDRAVAGAELRMTRPRWWTPVHGLQLALAALALAGILWLALLAGLGYLQLDDAFPTPEVRGLPVPTALLAGGLLAGLLVAFLARLLNGAGARRRARRARRALDERVAAVAERARAGAAGGRAGDVLARRSSRPRPQALTSP